VVPVNHPDPAGAARGAGDLLGPRSHIRLFEGRRRTL